MIIYEIKYKIDNRPYIGYSTKFNSSEEFLNSNYWGSGTYIAPAIKKYGKEAFERKVLLKNIFDKKELCRYEILMIKKRKSHISQGGYNLSWGGDGQPEPTEEMREKRKASMNDFCRKNPTVKKEFYKKNPKIGEDHSKKMIEYYKKHPNIGKGENNPMARSVILISPENQEYKLPCYTPFCREHHLNKAAIWKVLMGFQKKHKGWTGKYLEQNR